MSDDAINRAIASFTGVVTRCPPGKRPKKRGRTVWSKRVKERPVDPRSDCDWQHERDVEAERKRQERRDAKKRHVAVNNAPILKRIDKRDRRAAFNEEAVRRLNERK
jgi:hypothetical protein